MTGRASLVAVAAFCGCLAASIVSAQIIESDWNAALTGSQQWQVDANWSTPTFPNDPGRVDSNAAMIDDVIGANVAVGLGADLNLSVGNSDVTVASLRLGGTAGPVTTTISAGAGGRLVFENRELNNAADPDNVIPAFNFGRGLIVSEGVAGSTNIITAPIFINVESVDVGSYVNEDEGVNFQTTRDLTINGPITFDGTESTSSLNMEAAGRTLTINSSMVVNDIFMTEEGSNTDFAFNQSTDSAGTLILNGNITGTGQLQIGPRVGANAPIGTVYLNGSVQTDGGLTLGRTILVLEDNNSINTTGTIKQNSQTGSLGVTIVSSSDDIVVNAPMQLAQFVTIGGEHSLTWAGDVAQTNSRGWVNLLPEGKTFTLTGTQAADDQADAADKPNIPTDDNQYYFDGSGKTVVTGGLVNHSDEIVSGQIDRSFGKRGPGALYLQGSIQSTPAVSTYSGYTYVQGGNLHAATVADLGSTQKIKSTGGAIGLDNGTVTGPDSAAFLGLINSRAQATLTPQGDLKRTDDFSSGGLMLTASEASANLNFTTGALANAADMSVAAPEDGLIYTGTVTPANSTYRFGGGAGVITLPNANQLTGARSLVVTNGHDLRDRQGLGGVRITATNNYTGPTRIEGRNLTSNTDAAAVNGGVAGGEFNGTTLTVTSLANGGAASGVGASSNAASNLVLQGGTLRYEGAATSTDRLFTIGTRGATIDSSGAGAVVFSNTAALTIDTAEDRLGVVSGFAFGFEPNSTPSSQFTAFGIGDTSDLVPGMEISNQYFTESGDDDDEVITIVSIQSPTRVVFSDQINLFGGSSTPSTLSFVDVERTFTLTGDNTGDNILRPIIGDSASNVVNVAKEGIGKWILDAVNTYTGDTSIEAGILSITNDYLADDADVLIESTGVFDLDFAGMDDIGALFLAGASQPMGTYGAVGSGADFESAFFTGTGLLNVTDVVPTEIPGDYNNNGIVDAADYTLWRDNVGQPEGTLLNDPLGGEIGSGQYDQWAGNFGSTEVPEAALGLAVPEPSSLLLLIGFAAGAASRRRVA